MTYDMVGYVNDTLSKVHQPPKRWVRCEMCDGQGYYLAWQGADDWREQVERQCPHCDGGAIEIEEGDTRWDEGTHAHPND